MVFVACTVKGVVPAGVEPVVVMVSVRLTEAVPDPNETGFWLKEGVAPTGNAVVTLRLALNEPVPVPRFTVIA